MWRGEQRQIEAEQKGDKKMRDGVDELFIIFCGFNNRSLDFDLRVELSTIMKKEMPARQ